jgi:hypothetical protein
MTPAYTHVIVLALSEPCLLACLTVEMHSPSEPLITPPAPQAYSSQKAGEPGLREKIRERDRQRKLHDAVTGRLKLRRGKERIRKQLEAVRGEKPRLNSLTNVEQHRELWRLQDEERAIKHRKQKKLRAEAGLAVCRPPNGLSTAPQT